MADPIVSSVLDKNETFLRRHLVLSPTVVKTLAEASVISVIIKDKMLKQRSGDQVTTLIETLRRRDMNVFRKFLQTLKETHDGWLVNAILDTPMQQTKVVENTLFPKTLRDTLSDNIGYSEDKAISRRVPLYDDDRRYYDVRPPIRSYYKYQLPEYNMPIAPIPTASNMHGLHSEFRSQKLINDQTLSVLQQEERAIKDLLHQNTRDQAHLYRNQRVLQDIDRRLQLIEHDSDKLVRPIPDARYASERLRKLQRVSWR